MRLRRKTRKRDHRKLSLLIETRQHAEKFIYEWRLDNSRVGDVTAGKKVVQRLPKDTATLTADGAYDAREFYTEVEANGARPVVKPRRGYTLKAHNHPARPRALRWRQAHLRQWTALYHRRPIAESGNYSLKRRFGDRLWTHGLWRQRKELGLRVLVYNCNMVHRWLIRTRLEREVFPA